MGEAIEMCPDCKRPLATKAQWENNHNDGNGCQCAECSTSCWGGYDCRQAEKALKLTATTPVLDGSIDYAIAQIEKRFAPEIETLRAEVKRLTIAADGDGERISDLVIANDHLSAANARLIEALRIQDPRNATARYDMIADAFWKETGLWPPGRSAAPAMGIPESQREEAEKKWRPFVDRWHEDFFDAALSPTPAREDGE